MADPGDPPAEITGLLARWQGGDASALDELTPLVYRELHRIARRHLGGRRASETLQATALVHEAFLKLAGQRRSSWESRAHFYNLAATLMRRILVDHARAARRLKRGSDAPRVALMDDEPGTAPALDPADILTLDVALDELRALDARQCHIVELRYFAGLTIDEVAQTLELSTGTVKREWSMARAWLYQRLVRTP